MIIEYSGSSNNGEVLPPPEREVSDHWILETVGITPRQELWPLIECTNNQWATWLGEVGEKYPNITLLLLSDSPPLSPLGWNHLDSWVKRPYRWNTYTVLDRDPGGNVWTVDLQVQMENILHPSTPHIPLVSYREICRYVIATQGMNIIINREKCSGGGKKSSTRRNTCIFFLKDE